MMIFMRAGRGLALLFAAGLLTFAAALPGTSEARQLPCNGSVDLCDRPFDQVTLPGSHNAMSNAEQGWTIPNQTYSIPNQLDRGARAMLIDTYYGRPAPDGRRIENVSRDDRHQPGVDTYLCHASCLWGATELTDELGRVREFLAANPREVVVFVNEAYITPEDFASAVEQSGLIELVYTGSTTGQWPTLDQMIASGQRVVMLSEGSTGDVPWYHSAYGGTMQETPYSWPAVASPSGIEMLTRPELLPQTCVPNRGGESGSLFLMNHWVSGTPPDDVTPDPAAAEVVNQRAALVDRARACERQRGLKPTILAVDFFGTGDVVGAARELNGIVDRPEPPVKAPRLRLKRPKRVVAKAGRLTVIRVPIANVGDGRAAGVKVCARVPRRLARKPRCAKVSLPARSARVARLKTRTRLRARGRGKVRITVRTGSQRLATATVLRVKPVRRR